MRNLALDQIRSREGTVDLEAAVGGDEGCVEREASEAEVVQQGTNSVHFEVGVLLQLGVVVDDEYAEEPGPHDVVEEEVFAVLPSHGLGDAYASNKRIGN